MRSSRAVAPALFLGALLLWYVAPLGASQGGSGHLRVDVDYELFGLGDLRGGGHVTWTLTGEVARGLRARGLGLYAGFEVINVPGATGWIDTNYIGKAEHALWALKNKDIVYLHVEAPDEAGHTGDLKNKLKAIEDFDGLIVGNIIHGMKQFDEYRILALPDHPTPLELRTHSSEPVPFVIYDNRKERSGPPVQYDERIAHMKDALVFKEGYKLMDYFLKQRA